MSTTINQQNIKKFDRWSVNYLDGRMIDWFTAGQSNVLNAVRPSEDAWVLDVGCGPGWAVCRAAAAVPKGKACGIDLSQGMIRQAQAQAQTQGIANAEFKVADAESIPYEDGTFDAVICTNSFHHYSSPHQALIEMRRVLKPEGTLWIQDSDRKACLWVWLWNQFNRKFEKGHVCYYSRAEMLELIRAAGFPDAAVVSFDHGHFRRSKVGFAIYLIKASLRPESKSTMHQAK